MRVISKPLSIAIIAASMMIPISTFAFSQESRVEPTQNEFWKTNCTGSSRNSENLQCTALQRIFVAQSRKVLFSIKVLTPSSTADPILQITGPLNVYLPAGFQLSVDGSPLANMRITNCTKAGCFAAIKLPIDQMDTLKRGQVLRIDFSAVPDHVTTVETPLTGFIHAMDGIL